jgi:hypothetical protein
MCCSQLFMKTIRVSNPNTKQKLPALQYIVVYKGGGGEGSALLLKVLGSGSKLHSLYLTCNWAWETSIYKQPLTVCDSCKR